MLSITIASRPTIFPSGHPRPDNVRENQDGHLSVSPGKHRRS
jgi:hypothetical protein